MKTLLILSVFSLSLFGMSYETFKAKTLKNSKILKSQTLNLQTAQQQNNILLRAANPTLNLELSNYNEKVGGSDVEYAAGISQTIRTGSYMNGLQEKATATSLLSKAFVTQGRAGYIKTLETLYTEYVFQSKMLTLLKQEYTLSNRVTAMVKERYESGSENRVAYLQAKTETLTLKTQMYTTKQQLAKLYYQLLAVAGLTQKVSLEKKFIYSIFSKTKSSAKLSPQQQILKAKEKLYRSDYSINQSSFRNFDLYAGVEQEPDQGIVRVGVNIPLSINNDRSEERMLAKLKMQQTQLDNEQLSINTRSQKQMFKAAIRELSQQYYVLKTLQNEQQELTTLLQEGYKIAKGSLFQLMTAKNKLIQTRKALLQTQKMINDQKIELRFLQGDYND
ncbi:TolC family protein [Sulfurovum sp.]|uniref:TolC family protein n=1 Tax=Sulfurovum sp. TaxID=1969726 RepID=UPI00260DB3AA|nr:TolC family protein [Sulfurovum sp.]